MVDIPHPELGQEPFAIIEEYKDGIDKVELENVVVEKFGQEYALGGVCTLDELGFSTWPLNATAKVVKMELREAVLDFLKRSSVE